MKSEMLQLQLFVEECDVHHDYDKLNYSRNKRCYGGSADSHCRRAEVTEDEYVVEYKVDHQRRA